MSITLDDRDTAFAYTGPWAKMAADSDYDGTSTWTNLSVSTVNISFTGVQITVFGTIAPIDGTGLAGDGPTTFYTVDNSSTKQSYTAVQQADAQYRQQFFQSEVLSSGNHTLQIQYLANTGEYILDYAQIAIIAPTGSTSSPTVVPSTTIISPTTTVSAISSPASGHHSSPTIPIVVGVVGGLIFIGLIINGVIMWRKRKSRAEQIRLDVSAGNVTPFHPEPLQTEERTISTFVMSRETKSTIHLPPPAYENSDSQPTNDTHVVA
ncbi:hypothetical protein HYPSUDRAFT_68857 [Hypholoma sublateritium FD-334 SS-4]|uniref:Transmembrane protein n=1 Tax=Hypholoma sublateritium (strain FD-334 SS-4) TaxID=945553 RepID=A0A0D2M9S2_HYPSF|nr:hypothetical protein HYPSUDRAFT_68857 [Hypholoma sublateritium FD-334 SS-4]